MNIGHALSRTAVLSAFVSAVVLVPGLTTAGQTNAFTTLKSSYEWMRIEIAQTCLDREKATLKQYGKTLDALLADLQQKGDLDSYLAGEVEKKRFTAEGTLPDTTNSVPALATKAQAYQKALCDAQAEQNRQTAALLKRYVAALDGLIKQFVQAKKIEDAKAVKTERNRAASELADLEAKTPRIGTPVTVADKKLAMKGKTLVLDLGGGMKMGMIWIPPGKFVMGSPGDEKDRNGDETQHRVTLGKGFWMGKYEVTQEQWERVMGSNPARFKGVVNPVEQVSWNDCQVFLTKMNSAVKSQQGSFRLPTEAEWEYACRAGTATRFHNGDNDTALGSVAWYRDNSSGTTHSVGQKTPNAWGLYDMHGNVWEWCQDWRGAYLEDAVTDPTGPSSGSSRVVRGGSWLHDAGYCRVGLRRDLDPVGAYGHVGFRVVLPPGR